MSEEEKETLEFIKINNKHRYCDKDDVDFLLNLIEKQQKELDNLKEIEKSHKEENGKLRVELEQYKLSEANIDKANKIIAENKFDEGLYGLLMKEKEKNKELEEKLKIAKQLYNDACVCIATDCVEKDKVKDKIEETNNEKLNYSEDEYYLENEVKGYAIDKLKELLEEK